MGKYAEKYLWRYCSRKVKINQNSARADRAAIISPSRIFIIAQCYSRSGSKRGTFISKSSSAFFERMSVISLRNFTCEITTLKRSYEPGAIFLPRPIDRSLKVEIRWNMFKNSMKLKINSVAGQN